MKKFLTVAGVALMLSCSYAQAKPLLSNIALPFSGANQVDISTTMTPGDGNYNLTCQEISDVNFSGNVKIKILGEGKMSETSLITSQQRNITFLPMKPHFRQSDADYEFKIKALTSGDFAIAPGNDAQRVLISCEVDGPVTPPQS